MQLMSRPQVAGRRAGRWFRLDRIFHGAAMLLVAGIVHLTAVLSLPYWTKTDAYARISALASEPLRTVTLGAKPAQEGPASDKPAGYADPALATAYCVYDLKDGPVRIHIDVSGADFAALSLHSRRGRNFYGLTNRSASQGVLALTLMTSAQLAAAEARDSEDEPVQDLRVTAPEPRGFVQVQSLAAMPSEMPAALNIVRALVCQAVNPS